MPPPVQPIPAQQIRAIRLGLGGTPTEFAVVLNVPAVTAISWENPQTERRRRTLQHLRLLHPRQPTPPAHLQCPRTRQPGTQTPHPRRLHLPQRSFPAPPHLGRPQRNLRRLALRKNLPRHESIHPALRLTPAHSTERLLHPPRRAGLGIEDALQQEVSGFLPLSSYAHGIIDAQAHHRRHHRHRQRQPAPLTPRHRPTPDPFPARRGEKQIASGRFVFSSSPSASSKNRLKLESV